MSTIVYGAADRAYALAPAAVQTSAYTAAANQLVPVDTSGGAVTVTLPAAPPDLTRVAVKLLAGTNALTVAAAAGDVFDQAGGATTQTLTITGQGIVAQYSITGAIWYVASDDLPLAQLDARYNLVVNAAQYGATGNGSADDTAAIQAALDAASPGQTVYLPAGVYVTSAPLTVPSRVVLRGESGLNVSDAGDYGTVIKPAGSFSGVSVIYLADAGAAVTYGGSVMSLAVDGANLTGTVDGIRAFGPVKETVIRDVSICRVPGWGITTQVDAGISSGPQWPYMWDVSHVMLDTCGAGGLSLTSMTDAAFSQVYVLYCGHGSAPGPGWMIDWAGNSTFSQCRAEWCGTVGWHLTGSWWTGVGAGGMVMTGCSTDRNEQAGVLVDATGNGPLLADGLMLRRDGRNAGSGGGSYAGLDIAGAGIPISIGTISVFPGVDDDGTGTNSPEYGVAVSGSPLASIGSGYVQGATTAISNTASGGYFSIGPGMITATGTPAAPGSYVGQTSTGFEVFTGAIYANAGVDVDVAGQGLAVREGTNAKQGIATLAGGTVTVANTSVTANSRIMLTTQAPGGTVGAVYISARTPGTSFTITSTSSADTSTVAYEIFEQG